jgi:hypothetical protein
MGVYRAWEWFRRRGSSRWRRRRRLLTLLLSSGRVWRDLVEVYDSLLFEVCC